METNTAKSVRANRGKTTPRGFAAMDPEAQREIAKRGGQAAHERGTAHEFTSDEAKAAGAKGGTRVAADRAHMAFIGRLGGKSSAATRATRKTEKAAKTEAGVE